MPETTITGAATTPTLDAHLAISPVGDGPWPGVVVIHDAMGLADTTREHCLRLAAAGYVAVAPDLYPSGGLVRCIRSTFGDLADGSGPAFDDIDAARRFLAHRPDCTGRVGVVGFCVGGGFALRAATRDFDAAAPNYGMLPDDLESALRGLPGRCELRRPRPGAVGRRRPARAGPDHPGRPPRRRRVHRGRPLVHGSPRRCVVGDGPGPGVALPPPLRRGRLGPHPALLRHPPAEAPTA